MSPTYPRIVEGDPVFHSVSKPLEAQVGKVVEVVDHADVLPAAIFLLQHLWSADLLLLRDAGRRCLDTVKAELPPGVNPSGKA